MSLIPVTIFGAQFTTAEKNFLAHLADLTYAQGDILYYDGSNLTNLAAGTSGFLLATQGAGANPHWIAPDVNLSVPSSAGARGVVTSAFNSGYTSTAIGDLVYLDSSTTWQKADNTTSATTYQGVLGIALEVKASGNAVSVAMASSFIFATAWNLATVGAPVYMSTAGGITITQPSATDSAIRVIGWVVASGNGTTKIFFNPSGDYITHV